VTDQLEALFADLRAETLPQVRPPGIEAARHTVRRRRTTRTVATAAVAVAVAGGLVATAAPPATVRHQDSPAGQMRELAGVAKRALDDQLPRLAGRQQSGTVEEVTTLTFPGIEPGEYTLALACAGPGQITIDIEQARDADESSVLGRQIVRCGERPIVEVMPFRLSFRTPAVITITGGTQAVGNAAYAAELGGPYGRQQGDDVLHDDDAVAADESIQNADRAAARLTRDGVAAPLRVTTEQMRSRRSTGYVRPGNFKLWIACVGPGSLNVSVAAVPAGGVVTGDGQEILAGEFSCHEPATVSTADDDFSLPENTTMVISVVPDGAARNHAGWAYQVNPG
jgi:hypothetical protein